MSWNTLGRLRNIYFQYFVNPDSSFKKSYDLLTEILEQEDASDGNTRASDRSLLIATGIVSVQPQSSTVFCR